MINNVLILKDENNQMAVPAIWKETFFSIVEALKEGDFRLQKCVIGVRPISEEDAIRIELNLKSYGARLISLPEETWHTSVCQWMGSYWDVLIDLFTIDEGASDLVLSVRVYEDDASYNFNIQSVHVP